MTEVATKIPYEFSVSLRPVSRPLEEKRTRKRKDAGRSLAKFARDLKGIVVKPAITPTRLIDGHAPWSRSGTPTTCEAKGELFNKQR